MSDILVEFSFYLLRFLSGFYHTVISVVGRTEPVDRSRETAVRRGVSPDAPTELPQMRSLLLGLRTLDYSSVSMVVPSIVTPLCVPWVSRDRRRGGGQWERSVTPVSDPSVRRTLGEPVFKGETGLPQGGRSESHRGVFPSRHRTWVHPEVGGLLVLSYTTCVVLLNVKTELK